jgi:hypothetical protein
MSIQLPAMPFQVQPLITACFNNDLLHTYIPDLASDAKAGTLQFGNTRTTIIRHQMPGHEWQFISMYASPETGCFTPHNSQQLQSQLVISWYKNGSQSHHQPSAAKLTRQQWQYPWDPSAGKNSRSKTGPSKGMHHGLVCNTCTW